MKTTKTYIIFMKEKLSGVIIKHSEFKGILGDANFIIHLLNSNHPDHVYRIEEKNYFKNNYEANLENYSF